MYNTRITQRIPVIRYTLPSSTQASERSSAGGDVSQIMHDLQDSLERQNDLQDQLKFSEEELHIMRQKIDQLEAENESLSVQVRCSVA